MGTAQFSTVKMPPSFRAGGEEEVSPLSARAVKVTTIPSVYSLGVTLAVRYHALSSRL